MRIDSGGGHERVGNEEVRSGLGFCCPVKRQNGFRLNTKKMQIAANLMRHRSTESYGRIERLYYSVREGKGLRMGEVRQQRRTDKKEKDKHILYTIYHIYDVYITIYILLYIY